MSLSRTTSDLGIDTSSIFPSPRLRAILSNGGRSETSVTLSLARFHSLALPSLASLIALLLNALHGGDSIFTQVPDIRLLVIDDLSTPVLASYPTGFEEDLSRNKFNRKDHTDPTTKRNNVLKELAHKLASLAIKRNISVH